MSPRKSSSITFNHAHDLRRESTPPEARLWSYLRNHRLFKIHFRRQHPIGKYIVDFCAPRQKIIIELDGSQHIDHRDYDDQRNLYFSSRGYTILRFWNHEISNNIEGVILAIEQAFSRNQNPPPPTSPK